MQNHYKNTPIQIYRQFYNQKKGKFSDKNSDIFHISAQNIDCGYSLDFCFEIWQIHRSKPFTFLQQK